MILIDIDNSIARMTPEEIAAARAYLIRQMMRGWEPELPPGFTVRRCFEEPREDWQS